MNDTDFVLDTIVYEGVPVKELSDDKLVEFMVYIRDNSDVHRTWKALWLGTVTLYDVWAYANAHLVQRRRNQTLLDSCNSDNTWKRAFSNIMLHRKTMSDWELTHVGRMLTDALTQATHTELLVMQQWALNIKLYGVWELENNND